MAKISTFLKRIMEAVYGEEVRGSIHDALEAMNEESSNAMSFAATAKDSAKASAASAENSASTAAQKAAEALSSAGAAKTSEINAKNAENNAVAQASEAAKAAAGAKASETAAGSAQDAATQKAQEASDAQSAAARSEAEAKAAAERAKTVRTEVETFAAQASADKTAAEAAKNEAEAAKEGAVNSQTEAKKSENTALLAKTAAEFAKIDAQAAKTAAEAAKTAAEAAAQVAQLSENAASESAGDAAASALSARQYSGKPPKPQNGTWWLWDAGKQEYVDSGIGCELVGPTGNGIRDIQLTSGDHTPGTTDVYTVTMTDGRTEAISVYNGRNGTGAGDVLGIAFDLVLPAQGWTNGELTVADSRLLALAAHKYFLDAAETSREEYLDCDVRAKDITTTGFITFTSSAVPATDLTVNVIRLELAANGV